MFLFFMETENDFNFGWKIKNKKHYLKFVVY